MQRPESVPPADGKLLVLLPGMGAVGTTFIAGCLLARKGLGRPVGSLTEYGTIRLGRRTEGRSPKIREFVPLASLEQLVFAGWDVFEDDALASARHAAVLRDEHLSPIAEELSAISPMKAAFLPGYVSRLAGTHTKGMLSRRELVQELREDIRRAKKEQGAARAVCVWCGSTEVFLEPTSAHDSVDSFERALDENDPALSNSMLYAWACILEGVPFANGAPNLCVDVPAIAELARRQGVPICGKDFKTGQTLIKTVLAPALKARALGLRGWFSTNILGNRDGEVLDEPENFKTKEISKKGALEHILQPALYPDLYGDVYHKVRINYYPPRGDEKEGWDNLDIFGWLNYPMQLKVDFLCRDSILAAPLVLDLALFLDLAQRAGFSGIQEWLSFYFKSPMTAPGLYPEHDLFIQLKKLKNTLRWMMGEETISHLGVEYYESDETR